MIELKEILVSNLLLDLQNPRLAEGQQNQLDTLHAMLRAEGPKTLALAESIAKEGVSPIERLVVMPSDQDAIRFIVLEGNRRLTALKILSESALGNPVLTPQQQKRLKSWSLEYQKHAEVDRVECVVFASRADAKPWLERRHRGDQGGLGIVRWGATEAARFDARQSGKFSPELQVLDYVVQHGELDEKTREKLHDVPITNVRRLIDDTHVRDKLGLEIDGEGRVLTRFPLKETLKGLTRIIRDLAHNEIKVGDIYNAPKRKEYIGKFKIAELPSSGKALPAPQPLFGDATAPPAGEQASPAKKATPTPKLRPTLIPNTCKLNVTVAKIAGIYRELRKLKVEDYPNAVSVLLRVFLELSVDQVIAKDKVMTDEQLSGTKLYKKLIAAAEHLHGKKHLTDPQLKAVKSFATGQQLMAGSVTTLHQYVHNPHFSGSPMDLRAAWDNLQFFFEAVWPVR